MIARMTQRGPCRRLQRGFTNMHIGAIMRHRGTSYAPNPTSAWQIAALCHFEGANASTTLTDSSLYAEPMLRVGSPTISTVNFAVGLASGLFSGTSQNWTSTGTAQHRFDFGANDFTIEARVYPTTVSSLRIIASHRDSASNGGWMLYVSATGKVTFIAWRDAVATINFGGSTALSVNTWAAVSVVRIGTDVRIYVNGVSDGSQTILASQCIGFSDSKFYVGSSSGEDGTRDWSGNIDELRVVSGQGMYTTTYTPLPFSDPTDPGTVDGANFSQVISLWHMNGANGGSSFPDSSPYTWVPSLHGALTTSTVQAKWGTASMLSAANLALSLPAAGRFLDFSTRAFSFEFWCYPTTAGSDNEIYSKRISADGNYMQLIRHTSANKIRAFARSGGVTITDVTSSGTLTTNAWNFVQVIRQTDGHVKIYIGAAGTTTVTTDSTTGAWDAYGIGAQIGNGDDTYSNGFIGYIDDFRVTDGVQRPVAVPTGAFPDSYL